MDEHFFIYNGRFYEVGNPVIGTDSRSWMYGDGLFETMRIRKGKIINKDLHFERFYNGLNILKYSFSEEESKSFFILKIQELLQKNNIRNQARVRLMAIRRNAFESGNFDYLIEAWPLQMPPVINNKGLRICLSHTAKKSCDPFSNLKSNNYLSSVMALITAREMGVDECLVLNSANRICESAIANIFVVKEGSIYTPALMEGCVAGIVRRWLIENLSYAGFNLVEKEVNEEDLFNADEIFLTNSIKPIRWVETLCQKKFDNKLTLRVAAFIDQNMF